MIDLYKLTKNFKEEASIPLWKLMGYESSRDCVLYVKRNIKEINSRLEKLNST